MNSIARTVASSHDRDSMRSYGYVGCYWVGFGVRVERRWDGDVSVECVSQVW